MRIKQNANIIHFHSKNLEKLTSIMHINFYPFYFQQTNSRVFKYGRKISTTYRNHSNHRDL